MRRFSEVMVIFYILMEVWIMQVYIFVKTLKMYVYKLYISLCKFCSKGKT